MVLTLFNIFYVLIAIAMCILILLQSGAGAQAGSGFGGGASSTVFGARGASTFMSRGTGVLAALFFILSIAMGIYLHPSNAQQQTDLGLMSGVGTAEPAKATAAPTKTDTPTTPARITVPTAATAATAAAISADKPAPTAVVTRAAQKPAAAPGKQPAKPESPKKH